MTSPAPTRRPPSKTRRHPARGTQPAARPGSAPPRVEQLPPFRVLLHNDDHNDMVFVARTLMHLTPLNEARSVEVMLTAHQRGVALVCMTHKERAELMRDQLRSSGLVSTIEPAEG